MHGLSEKHKAIILLLKKHQQGLTVSQIAEMQKTTRQNINDAVTRLVSKGYAERRDGFVHLTKHGEESVKGNIVQSTKPFTKARTQRPHAIQANARLYRSSWSRIEPSLQALGIPYKKTLKGNIISFIWKERELRATSTWLYLHEKAPISAFQIPLANILNQAGKHAGAYIESFLKASGLRCLRDSHGSLAIAIRYWENGYPQNEIAEKSLKEKDYILYAYDRNSGTAAAWADKSINPFVELETNSERIDTEAKLWFQAIEDGELHPYEDEFEGRRHMAKQDEQMLKISQNINTLISIINAMQENQNQFIDMPQQKRRMT